MGDGGDDSSGAIGRCGDDATASGVLFIHRHGIDGDPVERREWVCALASCEKALRETPGATAHVQSAGQNSFGGHAALDAYLHDVPDAQDLGADFAGCAKGALVGQHELSNAETMIGGGEQELLSAREGVGNWPRGSAGLGSRLTIFDNESTAD